MKANMLFYVKRTVVLAVTLTAAILMTSAPSLHAQEVAVDNETGVGARAMGMGGANIAATNDLSAVIYNPAALTRLNNIEIQLGLNMQKRNIESTLKSTVEKDGTAKANTDYSGIGTVGVAYPMPTDRGSLVFAVAYNRAKNFESRYKLDGYIDDVDINNDEFIPGGFRKIDKAEEGGIGILSLAGGVDVSPNVAFGASFEIWMGSYRRNNRDLFNDYRDAYKYSELFISDLDRDISAWSFKPAVLYHQDNFRLGAFLRFPMKFNIEQSYFEEWDIDETDKEFFFDLYDNLDPDFETYNSYSEKIRYKIKAPMQVGLGLSFGRPGKTMLGIDLTYENWKQAKYDYPAYYDYEPNYFQDKYRSALSWYIGIEQPLPRLGFILRAGYLRNPLIFKGPRDIDSPFITVENERDYFTFGLGKKFDESLSVDAAIAYGFWSQNESNLNDEETRTRLFVSVSYKMPTRTWK